MCAMSNDSERRDQPNPPAQEKPGTPLGVSHGDAETNAVVAAIRSGDEAAFAALAEGYRRQLRVHCYRMLGSVDDAEDLVQETFLRAWRGREQFEGRSLFRTWLYRIATNACLNALERAPHRIMPQDVAPPVTATTDASEARSEPPWAPELPWVQAFPDDLLEPVAPSEMEPEAIVVSRETIELAFIIALQHLPARQRAILILREVLGWSAKETAALLDTTVKSVNAALQRARSTLRTLQPGERRAVAATQTERERDLLERFMAAWESKDAHAITALLREDARWSMPPAPLWFDGRAAIERLFELFPLQRLGDFRILPTAANRQPAAVGYLRPHGQSTYHLTGVTVLRVEGGEIAEVISFSPALVSAFRLSPTL
jgi:RNA polymerase sigma-70 factor (ECF subfamily)